MKERILIVANGHPDHSKGGAEAVAYRHFKEYEKRPDIEALFLAPLPGGSFESGTRFSCRSEKEVLFSVTQFDWFKCSAEAGILWQVPQLLEIFKPTVVHFHHFAHLGLQLLRVVRNCEPDIPIVMTLHEYMAICLQQGQMIKEKTHQLCYSESPSDCNRCFPDTSPADFLLRKLFFKSFFELVDKFVCPSQFLLERYADWGIPREKLLFIENGFEEPSTIGEKNLNFRDRERRPKNIRQKRSVAKVQAQKTKDASVATSESTPEEVERGAIRIGFFGQINPYKGLDVLLDAVLKLSEADRRKIEVTVHGGGIEDQLTDFQEKMADLTEKTKDCVRFHGKYDGNELEDLMKEVDWVVIPSIWWENSPVVIQEAFHHGRPIICSNIGGMKEKVRDGIDGIHFSVRNPSSLARIFESIIDGEYCPEDFHPNMIAPASMREKADEHLEVYSKLRAARAASTRID